MAITGGTPHCLPRFRAPPCARSPWRQAWEVPPRIDRARGAWRGGAWALACTSIAAGALLFSLSSAAAVQLPPPLGPCSGPSCPATFPPVNNGDFTGRDDTINVFAGGAYNVGVAGVGSRVPPPNGGSLPHTGTGNVLIWFLVMLGTLVAGAGLNRAARHRRGSHR